MRRRICWPNPDATCIEGGCLYCASAPYRQVVGIRRWCLRLSQDGKKVRHRGNGREVDPMEAFQYGIEHGFFNAPTIPD